MISEVRTTQVSCCNYTRGSGKREAHTGQSVPCEQLPKLAAAAGGDEHDGIMPARVQFHNEWRAWGGIRGGGVPGGSHRIMSCHVTASRPEAAAMVMVVRERAEIGLRERPLTASSPQPQPQPYRQSVG